MRKAEQLKRKEELLLKREADLEGKTSQLHADRDGFNEAVAENAA